MAQLPDWHYFEAHVTIDPVFDEELDKFKLLCKSYKFGVAELLMKKRKADTEKRSSKDSFCTGRDPDYKELETRMSALMVALKSQNYRVRRYKIESTLMDSRYHDELKILDKSESHV